MFVLKQIFKFILFFIYPHMDLEAKAILGLIGLTIASLLGHMLLVMIFTSYLFMVVYKMNKLESKKDTSFSRRYVLGK